MSAAKQWLAGGVLSLLTASCGGSTNASLTSPTAAAPISPSGNSISGVVTAVPHGVAWTPQTGTGVEGVLVEETNSHERALTGASGTFTIAGVSGPYAFSLSKPGYFDAHPSTIPVGATYVQLRIQPIPATYTLSGAVFEIAGDRRIALDGVQIQSAACDNSIDCREFLPSGNQLSTTDRNGLYSLTLYDGLNLLFVSKEGYQTDPPSLPNCDGCNATAMLNGDTRLDIELVRR